MDRSHSADTTTNYTINLIDRYDIAKNGDYSGVSRDGRKFRVRWGPPDCGNLRKVASGVS